MYFERTHNIMSQAPTKVGFSVQLSVAFEQAIEKVTEALKVEGFGILTEIDVKGTFKKKLDVDFRKYTILGACNPGLAYQALSINSSVGLLLPCNVTVAEVEDGITEVSIVDPLVMLGVIDSDEMCAVAEDAQARLQRVFGALQA
jgi:uncharacterized protein (DUF302 family)